MEKWILIYLLIGVLLSWYSTWRIKKNYPKFYNKIKYKVLQIFLEIFFYPLIFIYGVVSAIRISSEMLHDPWVSPSNFEEEAIRRIEEHFKFFIKKEEEEENVESTER